MFGTPSSPPSSNSSQNCKAALGGSLLPAFGHDDPPASAPDSPTSFRTRELLRPKFSIFRDYAPKQGSARAESTLLPTPLPTSEANARGSSPPPSSPLRGEPGEDLEEDLENIGNSRRRSSALQQLIVVRVPTSGREVTIGRSSKSSSYAVKSTNRLASRVHAKLAFSADDDIVTIECLGWNGLSVFVPIDPSLRDEKTHYPVSRGQTLNVERADGITIDIHGDKALVELYDDSLPSEMTEDEAWSQISAGFQRRNSASPPPSKRVKLDCDAEKENYDTRYARTVSETELQLPAEREAEREESFDMKPTSTGLTEDQLHDSDRLAEKSPPELTALHPALPLYSEASEKDRLLGPRETGSLASGDVNPDSRGLEKLKTESSLSSRASSAEPSSDRKARRQHVPLSDESRSELTHVIANHIAFSRLSAVPFASLRKANSLLQSLPRSQVRELVRSVPCVGVIEGGVEDTTGRKAEDEYYYDLVKDENEERRQLVQTTKGHRSLRNCRKTPKQYFYRPLHLG